FFFSGRRRHTRSKRDWSSDVCSSDLDARRPTDNASSRLRSFPRAMIRTLWFYLVVVVSSVIHATGVIVAALLGVKRRPGGGDVRSEERRVGKEGGWR